MSDSTALDSFIAAQNFCTGSQSDYSTCIANNMRFTAYSEDDYQASVFGGLTIKNAPLPYLYGDIFVDLQPIAVANVLARVKMINDFGVVSFRCSDIFNRPSLPLPKLQDLGIPAQDIINIIGVDPTEPNDPGAPVDPLLFEGIPISNDDSLVGWMFNCINLLIGYTTAISTAMTLSKTLNGIILGSLDYYELPSLSLEMQEELNKAGRIYEEYYDYSGKILASSNLSQLIYDTASITEELGDESEGYVDSIVGTLQAEVVDPLSIINAGTDFSTFDFSITDGVSESLISYNEEEFPFALNFGYSAKQVSSLYGIPPTYPIDEEAYSKRVITMFAGLFTNLVAEMLNQTRGLYSASSTMSQKTQELENNDTLYSAYISYAYALNTAEALCNDEKYEAIAVKTRDLTNTYTLDYNGKYLPTTIDALYDPADRETTNLVAAELDEYFDSAGNAGSIALYSLITTINNAYDNTLDDRITEVNLGGNFKDSGNFYYADIAYSVGYGKLEDIKSIQIDDEYYELVPGVDDNGVPVRGISESGCTKYTFTRHVLPTYDVEVEMYIYPGVSDQPYCPTINKYHNFNTSKYYGMFTKMDGDLMGVYLYRGYSPMKATVDEVLQIGRVDLNAINLNDPSLDQKSYETMMMRDVKNLTNASSINGSPLTTNDFKYYLASQLIDDTETNNYPGMAVIEFKNFPLGKSIKPPKIRVNVVSEDII